MCLTRTLCANKEQPRFIYSLQSYFSFLVKRIPVIIQQVVQQDVKRANGQAHWAVLERFLMSKIKPVFKCEEQFKTLFKQSQCLLTISVGQEVHEGEKFEKTVQLVNDSFRSCVVLVDDTLQRHTMAIETNYASGDELLALSKEEGVRWLSRSLSVLKRLSIPYEIITWDVWLGHNQFSSMRESLNFLYHSDKTFSATIDKTIDEFLVRYDRRDTNNQYFHNQRARGLCREYLIEECTAMCLWPELKCQFEVYPSHRNAAMAEVHKRFVLSKHSDLLHAVRVKFKNKKQLKPQNFQVLASRELRVANAE